jgi:hypothetical protein
VNGFNIEVAELVEDDGFTTIHMTGGGGGTFDISGRVTLTPADHVEQPPQPPRWPDATTTGVPDGTPLTTVTAPVHPADTITGGTYHCRVPGARYEGLRLPFLVQVHAPGVQFKHCRFTGTRNPPGSSAMLLIRDDRPAVGPPPSATATRCTFIPDHPSGTLDAVRGSQFRLTACEIARTVDGVHIFGSTQRSDPHAGDVLVERCWVHDLRVFPDAGRPDGFTHNDDSQLVGGSRVHLIGNRLEGGRKAAVMVGPSRNDIADLWILDNYLGVSAAAVNLNDSRGPGPILGLRIEGNTIARQTHGLLISGRTLDRGTPAITGNTWADDGTPVPVRRGA